MLLDRTAIPPNKTFAVLTFIIILLMLASVASYGYSFFSGEDYYLDLLAQKFYIDSERTIPTWFSSSMLLMASFILAIIAFCKRKANEKYFGYWGFLSFGFLILSVDESVSLHEEFFDFISPLIGIEFKHFWVIVASPIVLLIFVFYLRFLWSLPKIVRTQFIVAACLYVGGAIGVETIGGFVAQGSGKLSYSYMFLAHVEEFLEMFGIAIFLSSLRAYVEDLGISLSFATGNVVVEESTMTSARESQTVNEANREMQRKASIVAVSAMPRAISQANLTHAIADQALTTSTSNTKAAADPISLARPDNS